MTLRTRLSLALVVAAAAGALVFAVAARATVERLLYANVDRDLRNQVVRTLGNAQGERGVRHNGLPRPPRDNIERRAPGPFFGRGAPFAQVRDGDGTTLLSTSAVEALGGLPEPRIATDERGTHIRTARIAGERFRIAEAAGTDGIVLQVAQPLTELAGFLDTLLWVLLAAGVTALAAAAVLGRWVARATLRPVETMTRTAREIARAPRDLSTRVEPAFPDRELAEFAESMNEMLASISESDHQQRRFVADASHELRTPLTSLGGNAAYLDRTTELDEPARDALDAVQRDIGRLIRIADGLTTLARLDAVPVMQLEPVDVATIANEAMRRSASAYPDHHYSVSGCPGLALLDAELVRRIFSNLLDNAGRYTPPGSHVTVTLDDREDGSILIDVTDDGAGLPDEERERVLERFYRGSTAAGAAGTGLGLSIVLEAAQALGGTLELSAATPHGLHCRVRLAAGSGPLAAG